MDSVNRDIEVSLRGVYKSFGEVVALDDVNLDVPGARVTGVIGPGASGKTVMSKIVAGLVRPDRGEVQVGGMRTVGLGEMDLQKMRSRIGMLFQNNALFDYLTVGENVAFPLRRLFNLGEEEIRARVAESLGRVGLGGMEERAPGSLSGGEKKRVGLARCTVARQPILIYDDPTAGLDPVTASKIFLLLREDQIETGSTVLAISSDVDSLIKYVDCLAIMGRGRVLFFGGPEEAFDAPDPWARNFVRGEWRSA